ncbi:MAG: Maf family protein [Pseudomonadota bacterium]
MADRKIYLASRSPRRSELLQQIGVEFEVLAPDVNESPLPREAPTDYVRRITRIKAEVGWMQVVERKLPRRPLLAADTAVALGRRILGKPADRSEAVEMLKMLSGARHRVHTAVAVVLDGRLELALSTTAVRFRELSEREIRHYVAGGEPLDKAGAYAIQGRAAAFIAGIEGSYSGVMGLPLYETALLLAQFGLEVL